MSNYVKIVDYATKDSLPSGNPLKKVSGTELDTEFEAIETAVATKADLASPTFTGTPVAPTAAADTNTTQIATTANVVATAVKKSGDTMTGRLVSASGTTTGNNAMATATLGLGEVSITGNGTGAAMMNFHRPSAWQGYFGIDTDNKWKIGGASHGANAYEVYTTNNLGSYKITCTAAYDGVYGAVHVKADSPAITFQDTTDNRKWMLHNAGDIMYFHRAATATEAATDWAEKWRIGSNGNTVQTGTVTATDFTISSDPILKDFNHFIYSGDIDRVSGYSFKWNTNIVNECAGRVGKESLGVNASEVEAVYPCLVSKEVISNQEIKVVNYNGLVAVLIEEVKSLRKRVADLENKNGFA